MKLVVYTSCTVHAAHFRIGLVIVVNFRRGARCYRLPVAAILDFSKWPPPKMKEST